LASSSNALLSLTNIAAELEPFLDWEELSARVEDETLMGHHLSGIATDSFSMYLIFSYRH
jgi:hypothetical protein